MKQIKEKISKYRKEKIKKKRIFVFLVPSISFRCESTLICVACNDRALLLFALSNAFNVEKVVWDAAT